VNRLKYLGALVFAAVLVNACGPQSPSEEQTEQTDEAASQVASAGTTAGSSLQVNVFPYALPGETFPVIVSSRSATGQLVNAGNVTVRLSANPTGATLLGSTTKALVNGVARFDLSLKAGQGYAITASSTQGSTSTSAPFNVAYSQDVGSPAYTLSSAPVISPKVPMFGALNPGEVHYYKFPATAGQQLSVSTYADRLDNVDWDTSMRVRLIAPDGTTELASAGAARADAPEVDNGLSLVRIPQDGDYYLACDLDEAGRLSGRYAMVMTLAADPGISLQTEAEPWGITGQNDTIATAQKLFTGTLYGHYDSTPGSQASDFYAIAVSNPVRVRLDLNAARSGAAYGDRAWIGRLELQDASGAVLWANDRSYGLDPAIDYVITRAGTYYVRVTASDDQPNGRSSPYFLNYQATPYVAAAETAANATASGATTLRYGSDVTGSFSAAGTHWFGFAGTAGDVVRLVVQDRTMLQTATLTMQPPGAMPAAAGPTADVTVLQGDGATELPAGSSFIDASESRLNYRQTILPATGTYFVRVRSTGIGKFGLRLERLTTSAREVEPNDTATTATLVPAGGWISGSVSSAEQDHFKVHAEAGQLVTVSVLAGRGAGLGSPLSDWGSSLVPSLQISDSLGNVLSATSARRNGPLDFAETLQHPLVAQIGNVPPTLQASFRAPAAGDFDVLVTDADGQGGTNYFYALNVSKNQ
jgi:hypothetical protein